MKFTVKERYDIEDLLRIMELLRSEEGCVWDREQDHHTIRNNFIEESYEAVEAIDRDDPVLLQEDRVVPVDGLHRLVALFDEIVADGVVVLFPVPDTALLASEKLHDPQQILDVITFLHCKLHHAAPPNAFTILTDKP